MRPNGAAEVKAVRAYLLRGTYCGQRTDLDDEFSERHEQAVACGLVVVDELDDGDSMVRTGAT